MCNDNILISKNKYNFILPLGLGDTYFMCCYKDAYEKLNNIKVHFLIKHSHEIIMKMFGISDYTCVDLTADFYQKNIFTQKPEIGKLYIAHPSYNRPDIMKKWNKGVLNLRDLYIQYLGIPENSTINFPINKVEKRFEIKNVDLSRCIFISTSAKSTPSLIKKQWENILSPYFEKGYTVINNCLEESDSIPNCYNLSLSLDEIIYIASKCHKSYCLRSGLCDILFYYLGKKLNVIYPNKNLLDLYSINNCFLLDKEKQVQELVIGENNLEANDLVTIITPTFNLLENGRKEKFYRMLESIKNQTYENIEHIIVDGKSTDGTVDYLRELALKYRFNLISEEDFGLYDAMNKGVRNAKGTYICFLNSDDYFTTYAIEKHIKSLRISQADFSFAKAIIKKSNERDIFHPCEKIFFFSMPFCHQTMFTKKELLQKYPFDLEYKLAADFDFIQNTYQGCYKSTYVDYITAIYDASGLSGQHTDLVLSEYVKILKKHWKKLLNLSDKEISKAIYHHKICTKMSAKFIHYFRKISKNTYERIYYDLIPHFTCKYKLLSLITIKQEKTEYHESYRLGVLPLFKIKWKNDKTRFSYKILGIKFLDIVKRENYMKAKLFGIFNILTIKQEKKLK